MASSYINPYRHSISHLVTVRRLAELPPGFWYDEAYNAMDSIWMLDTRSPTLYFIQSNSFREPLLLYLGAFSMALLALNLMHSD